MGRCASLVGGRTGCGRTGWGWARRCWSRIGRRGVAALEFGLLAPALLLVMLGGFDLVQTLRAQLRVEAAATQLGQIVSRCPSLTTPGDTALLWAHGQRIVGSLGLVTGATASGGIIVTAVYGVPATGGAAGVNRVAWQQRTGLGTLVSSVGSATRTSLATIAGTFIVPPGQTLIVTEIFVRREALVFSGALVGDALPQILTGRTLFLTRAPDAAAVQTTPATSNTPACLA